MDMERQKKEYDRLQRLHKAIADTGVPIIGMDPGSGWEDKSEWWVDLEGGRLATPEEHAKIKAVFEAFDPTL